MALMTRRLASACLTLLAAAATASAQAPLPPPPVAGAPSPEALATITDDDIRGHMTFLASDLMRGRDTLSNEIRLASEYLATRLMMAGAEPVGDRVDDKITYFASFPLEYTTPQETGTELEFLVGDEADPNVPSAKIKAGVDFVTIPLGLKAGETAAPLVFAGEGRDEDYENLDVKGKFVVIVEPKPEEPAENADGNDRPRRARFAGSALFQKANRARSKEAAGLIALHTPGTEQKPYGETLATFRNAFGKPAMTLGRRAGSNFPIVAIEDAARDRLAESFGTDLNDLRPGPLEDAKATFRFVSDDETKYERNVIGLFPGSHPEKAKEVIIYSAHYDHVGVGGDGQIFNGSDDNASGTSALLELAQAFGHGPRPERSIAFLWVSGEEKGLLGSRYFADHVTLPEGYRIVGNINMDMVSRNDGYQIGITPSPKHPKHSTLTVGAVEACEAEGIEPQWDADQFFFRTDSASFAAKDIPVIFFFSGIHPDYHQPTDDFDKADFAKAARIARVAYRLGWNAANADEPPQLVPGETQSDKGDDEANKAGD